MDLAGVSAGVNTSGIALNVNLSVLDAIQALDQTVAAQLAASIGLGANVDSYA
jgi:hypothetical protein